MRRAGRPLAYIFGIWGGIAAASGIAAMVGSWAFAGADPALIAAVTALAAGAILAMLVDTMIPEAFETAHDYAGLISVAGFLVAFTLSRVTAG
jgi:ZIP family zinc transporter